MKSVAIVPLLLAVLAGPALAQQQPAARTGSPVAAEIMKLLDDYGTAPIWRAGKAPFIFLTSGWPAAR